MVKSFFEPIIASGGFAGEVFDVAQGPANTDVVDVLLSASGGTTASILQENAPVNLLSTGELGGDKELDITGVEQDGRFFFFSIRNTDISSFDLTITATTDINGGGASFVVSEATDLIFVHESGGTWRAYEQQLPSFVTDTAAIFRDTFTASDWSSGTINNITIIQSGTPGAGEIGPHSLAIAGSYLVQVYRDSDDELVDVGIVVDESTGDISLTKAGLGTNFDGRVIVAGTE